MSGSRTYSSIWSRATLGKRTGWDDEAAPSAVRLVGPKSQSGGGGSSRFRRRGAGDIGGPPLLRFLARGATRPRTVLLGLLLFVASLALYFFGRAAHRVEDDKRRLTEPERLAEDLPEVPGEGRSKPRPEPWKPPVLPPEVFREVPPEECEPSSLTEKIVDPSEYEFGCDEIEEMLAGEAKLIGNGNIRDVYLVEWEGRTLVVKALREDFELRAAKHRADKIHRWEAAALNAVRGHPNIVGLLGICESSSVSEYFPTHVDDLVLTPGAEPLPIASVVSMALDAARGLQAMHEASGGAIVHYDIKPQQLMLDESGTVKINDLNMCKFAPTDADGNSCAFPAHACNPGPFRAPENIAGEPLTERVDVYSLAMTFYSMLALKPPYTGEPGSRDRILNGIPPSVDPSWHPGVMEIVQDMWQRDPNKRPSARRVADRLEIMQKQMQLDKEVTEE